MGHLPGRWTAKLVVTCVLCRLAEGRNPNCNLGGGNRILWREAYRGTCPDVGLHPSFFSMFTRAKSPKTLYTVTKSRFQRWENKITYQVCCWLLTSLEGARAYVGRGREAQIGQVYLFFPLRISEVVSSHWLCFWNTCPPPSEENALSTVQVSLFKMPCKLGVILVRNAHMHTLCFPYYYSSSK